MSVGGGGTATSGTDYAAVTDFDIAITKGTTSWDGDVHPDADPGYGREGNETVGVVGTSTGLTVNSAELTLTDDDGAPAVNLPLNPSSVGEGASATSVTAAFANATAYAADKTVTVTMGGGGTATSGTGYTAV